jgi:hypothetical protein
MGLTGEGTILPNIAEIVRDTRSTETIGLRSAGDGAVRGQDVVAGSRLLRGPRL